MVANRKNAVGTTFEELRGLWVSVDRVEYVEGNQAPPDRPHQFVYYITIHNDSDETVTIVGRKWIVTNSIGHKLIVEGDGVVGEFPRLTPGDNFHYNSYHLLDSDSSAEGAYLGKAVSSTGARGVMTRIPKFSMKIPSSAKGSAG